MKEIVDKYFDKIGSKFCKNMNLILPAILKSGSSNTSVIASEMAHFTKKDFRTNDRKLYRFLQDKNFQINDKFWRCHINLIFDFFKNKKIFKKHDIIPINIDITNSKKNFLILSASILINNKAVSLYFSLRKYPSKTYKMSQNKMEEAFIKSLKHLLPKKYKYILIADRAFGNLRFSTLCEKNGFKYVLRMRENIQVIKDEKTLFLKDFKGKNEKFNAFVPHWNKNCDFEIHTKNDSTLFLLYNTTQNPIELYEKRFKIEKLFQDEKSSGFDFENTKIEKFDRFKRLLYLISLAHFLIVTLGNFLETCKNDIKKKFQMEINLISVFLSLDNVPSYIFSMSHLNFSKPSISEVDDFFVGE